MNGVYDIAVIGGGINGCGVARDAAGRGLSVCLLEQGDLGGGTSSASTKLIHGGLRYLENGDFRLVREALREREILWGLAPHLISPARFILPTRPGVGRSAALLRLGLFLYDHLGGRKRLPATARVDLRADPAGAVLRSDIAEAYAYADCRVDDARLVIANARDAARRGAAIFPRVALTQARRVDGVWELSARATETATDLTLRARILINAAGPWVDRVQVDRAPVECRGPGNSAPPTHRVRLVQGSHIAVPRMFEHDSCYTLQNDDGRVCFVLPYEDDWTLIGATDVDYAGDPADVRPQESETQYLCAAVSRWFARPVSPQSAVWRYAGVRPLYDDGVADAQAVSRDHVLVVDAPTGAAPLLTIYGGKLTSYRRLAEAALDKLRRFFPARSGAGLTWTASFPLPGGNFPLDGLPALVGDLRRAFPFLSAAHARRLARAYGTEAAKALGGARRAQDLGRDFGATLSEAEVCYLMSEEWARSADDALWRRSKLGLRMSQAQMAALAAYMGGGGR